MTRVLGLDVGNGKLKACLIDWQGDWAHSRIHWDSLPLPVSDSRPDDFEFGLPLAITRYLALAGTRLEALEQVVVCCSQSFSYHPFSESIRHLAGILRLFREVPVGLIRADGHLSPPEAIAALDAAGLYAYTFTNFYGSALLGSRLIRNGLSLDLGTTTLDVIPIVDGRIDPLGLAQPADYLRFRYTHGRIHWLGLTTVPLCMLATRVPLGDALHQIVPRSYRSEVLFGLAAAEGELLTRHAYGHRFPAPAACRRQLAEFVGLDDAVLSEAEIQAVRDYLFDRLIERVADEIRRVAEQSFGSCAIEIASFALGEALVLAPALERAGVDARRIRRLELGREQQLWSASSAFAMALLALEQSLGMRVGLPA